MEMIMGSRLEIMTQLDPSSSTLFCNPPTLEETVQRRAKPLPSSRPLATSILQGSWMVRSLFHCYRVTSQPFFRPPSLEGAIGMRPTALPFIPTQGMSISRDIPPPQTSLVSQGLRIPPLQAIMRLLYRSFRATSRPLISLRFLEGRVMRWVTGLPFILTQERLMCP